MSKRVFGTREWASHNRNCQKGCEHGCWYCYAAASHRGQDFSVPSSQQEPPTTIKKVKGHIMFPTRHDITAENYLLATRWIKHLVQCLDEESHILLVTKPAWAPFSRMLEMLEPHKDRILLRLTIGSMDSKTLNLFEPAASSFGERLECLVWAHMNGWRTSVSCEPCLMHPEGVPLFVAALSPFVTDGLWIGKMNYAEDRLTKNSAPKNVRAAADMILTNWTEERIRRLYEQVRDNPRVRWKESLKEVLGLDQVKPGSDQ
tara:strand:+ start:5833 stop:6612 length:780 start_codon:yes stop_codon:yes gene_type:complete